MPQLFDAAFADGDFVIENGDFVTITDNAVIVQSTLLNLNLQAALNQYDASAGWDWMRWLGANVSQDDIDTIRGEIKGVCERVGGVLTATVAYLGFVDDELSFDISLDTEYGATSISFALGGIGVQL